MPDGTPIEENLWNERRKYYFNINVMNILARSVTTTALLKEKKEGKLINSKEIRA